MELRIGVSGWRYAPWRGVFYPPGLVHDEELAYASRLLPSVEINGSFYSLQRPSLYARWYADTPPGFVFAIKGSRYITHMLKLRGADKALANFFASGLFELKEKLGPIVWQLPPQARFDPDRVEAFLTALPRDTAAALAIARRRDRRVYGRSCLKIDRVRPLRHALEVRHDSYLCERFIALLRAHGVALVVAETAGRWPLVEDVTAEFVYLRLHGDKKLYASGYGDRALDAWASRIRAWASGGQPGDARLVSSVPPPPAAERDVYCYFDNDAKVHAPFDAARLLDRLGLPSGLDGRQRPRRQPSRRPSTLQRRGRAVLASSR